MEWSYNDKLRPRGRKPACVIVAPSGAIHVFTGQTILGVVVVLGSSYDKNGKWSSTTYRCLSPDGTQVVSWVQDWNDGKHWPQDTWEAGRSWLQEQVSCPVERAAFETVIRARWGGTAVRWDANDAARATFATPPAPAQRYLLNSAVLTAFGQWDYQPLTHEETRAWVLDHCRPRAEAGWLSTIGYPETAMALDTLCGLTLGTIPVSRRTITMQPGDEALVFRLVFPTGYRPDPTAKGAMGLAFIREHSECGLLRRLA